jgi:F-type H+-transporting ATPase subunit b
MTQMRRIATLIAMTAASPALAASGPFISLRNTDFVVLLGFLLFIGILFYFKVPSMIAGLLDKRAEGIRADLAEARALREAAQDLLATYERRKREVQEQADRIVTEARAEATKAADKAKADLKLSIARRLAAAEEKIASAEAAAIRDVRHAAIGVATAAARDLLAKGMTAQNGAAMIDASITEVGAKLH